jgi:peptide deformylase
MSTTQGLEFDAEIQDDLDFFAWTAENLPIRFFGDEVLHRPCEAIAEDEFGAPGLSKLAKDLTDSLAKYREKSGLGRGLAANQIGFSQRVMVVWLFDDKPVVMVNPKMISSEGTGSYWESCISSGAFLIGEVHRPWKGKFEYQDVKGQPHHLDADEKETRILLHEIDHLEGIICSEKYVPDTMRFVRGGREEIQSYPLKRIDT